MALFPNELYESADFQRFVAEAMERNLDNLVLESFGVSTAQAAPDEYVCEKCGRRFPAPLYGRSVIHDCGVVIDAVAVDIPQVDGFKAQEWALQRARAGLLSLPIIHTSAD